MENNSVLREQKSKLGEFQERERLACYSVPLLPSSCLPETKTTKGTKFRRVRRAGEGAGGVGCCRLSCVQWSQESSLYSTFIPLSPLVETERETGNEVNETLAVPPLPPPFS